jgi:hypothetical protein
VAHAWIAVEGTRTSKEHILPAIQGQPDKGKRKEDKKENNKRKQHVPRNKKEKDTSLVW